MHTSVPQVDISISDCPTHHDMSHRLWDMMPWATNSFSTYRLLSILMLLVVTTQSVTSSTMRGRSDTYPAGLSFNLYLIAPVQLSTTANAEMLAEACGCHSRMSTRNSSYQERNQFRIQIIEAIRARDMLQKYSSLSSYCFLFFLFLWCGAKWVDVSRSFNHAVRSSFVDIISGNRIKSAESEMIFEYAPTPFANNNIPITCHGNIETLQPVTLF